MDNWFILAVAIMYPKQITPEQAYHLYYNEKVHTFECKVKKYDQKLKEILSSGGTIREASKELKINYSTIRKYIVDYNFYENNGLESRKRGPKRCIN